MDQDKQARKRRRQEIVQRELNLAKDAGRDFDESFFLKLAAYAINEMINVADFSREMPGDQRKLEQAAVSKLYGAATNRLKSFTEGDKTEYLSLLARITEEYLNQGVHSTFSSLRASDHDLGEVVVISGASESQLPEREPDQN
jgi:hypothetical protein